MRVGRGVKIFFMFSMRIGILHKNLSILGIHQLGKKKRLLLIGCQNLSFQHLQRWNCG